MVHEVLHRIDATLHTACASGHCRRTVAAAAPASNTSGSAQCSDTVSIVHKPPPPCNTVCGCNSRHRPHRMQKPHEQDTCTPRQVTALKAMHINEFDISAGGLRSKRSCTNNPIAYSATGIKREKRQFHQLIRRRFPGSGEYEVCVHPVDTDVAKRGAWRRYKPDGSY